MLGDDEDFLFFAVDEAARAPLHEVEAGVDCLVDRGGASQISHVDVGRR